MLIENEQVLKKAAFSSVAKAIQPREQHGGAIRLKHAGDTHKPCEAAQPHFLRVRPYLLIKNPLEARP